MKFNFKDVQSFLGEVQKASRIVITAHMRPDGDAVGSALGLAGILRKMGKNPEVVVPDSFDAFLSWMPGAGEMIVAEKSPNHAEQLVKDADLLFILDYSATKRVGKLKEALEESRAFKIMIDHHIDPEDIDNIRFHSTKASSTAELVWHLAKNSAQEHLIDQDIAACLYTGIMTDTGSFRYSSTSPAVHRITAELLETGIDPGIIQHRIFNNFSEKRTRFLGMVLKDKLKTLPEYKTAYMVLSRKEIHEYDLGPGDTEGFVNYNLSIKGTNFGVLMKEAHDRIKISFRSVGEFPCNEFAAEFNGGGHHNASGGVSFESLKKTEERFLTLLDKYKSKLNYEV